MPPSMPEIKISLNLTGLVAMVQPPMVKSLGGLGCPLAMGPSPLPVSPWQRAQCTVKSRAPRMGSGTKSSEEVGLGGPLTKLVQ